MTHKTNILIRAVSKGVDLILVFALMEALPRAGWLAGVLYILISDGLAGGQSLGKKLTGLKVVGPEGRPCDIRASILRNAVLCTGIFLFKIPVAGWILLLAAIAFESITLIGSAEGKRFGDELAGTTVVEETDNQEKGKENIA